MNGFSGNNLLIGHVTQQIMLLLKIGVQSEHMLFNGHFADILRDTVNFRSHINILT